jgi:predicted transcriptional regulator
VGYPSPGVSIFNGGRVLLRVRITPLQLAALRAVWPRLLEQLPPNCTQLILASGWGASKLIGCLNRLAKKNVLRWWRDGRSRRWGPAPLSDHLQEEGFL